MYATVYTGRKDKSHLSTQSWPFDLTNSMWHDYASIQNPYLFIAFLGSTPVPPSSFPISPKAASWDALPKQGAQSLGVKAPWFAKVQVDWQWMWELRSINWPGFAQKTFHEYCPQDTAHSNSSLVRFLQIFIYICTCQRYAVIFMDRLEATGPCLNASGSSYVRRLVPPEADVWRPCSIWRRQEVEV